MEHCSHNRTSVNIFRNQSNSKLWSGFIKYSASVWLSTEMQILVLYLSVSGFSASLPDKWFWTLQVCFAEVHRPLTGSHLQWLETVKSRVISPGCSAGTLLKAVSGVHTSPANTTQNTSPPKHNYCKTFFCFFLAGNNSPLKAWNTPFTH